MKLLCSLSHVKTGHDAALSRIREMGFDAVDLILIPNWGITDPVELANDYPQASRRVKNALSAHGLRAGAVNCAFNPQLFEREEDATNEARRQQIRAVCRLMQDLEIPVGAHYPGHIADWKNDPEGVWAGTVKTLREIQEIAEEEQVTLGPEIHFNTPFEHPDAARRLLREIPGIPYTYEPSHFMVKKLDPFTTGDLLDGAQNCHLRTCAPGRLQAPPPEGLDVLDWMMARLRDRNYEGSVSIEYLPGDQFPGWEAIHELQTRYADRGCN
jgi:sugar phosphate isomerase/epimerase